MNLPRYAVTADEQQTTFEFVSEGPNGLIAKLVQFTSTGYGEFYNLAFGDKSLSTGALDDLSISNNGDSEKVLATVVGTVYAFCARYPEAWVFATGSTPARTRLYRMGLNRFYAEVVKDFDIYGLRNGVWEVFRPHTDYTAFVAHPKNPSN